MCLSCETMRPVEEANVVAASSSGGLILGGSSGGSIGGFTCGARGAATVVAGVAVPESPTAKTVKVGEEDKGADAASAPGGNWYTGDF